MLGYTDGWESGRTGLEGGRLREAMRLRTWSTMPFTLFTLSVFCLCVRATSPGVSLSQRARGGAAPARLQPGSQSLLSTADSIFEQMSHITGLPIRSTLKKELVSRAEVRRYLTGNLQQEYSAEELHFQEAALKAFG